MTGISFPYVRLGFCAAFASFVLAGCGSSGPKTYPVTGKVTAGGKPVKNCAIHFQPVDSIKQFGSDSQIASGQIADDGTYTLYTGTTGTRGAMAGKYKVVLQPTAGAGTAQIRKGEREPAAVESNLVPKEYTDALTTPKEVEVTTGSNTINIEILSDAPADSGGGGT